MLQTNLTVLDLSVIKSSKCTKCETDIAVLIIGTYIYEKDEVGISTLCTKCFREYFPTYTLEHKCIVCYNNFNCSIQTIIFTKKEIKKFKRDFF